MHYGWSTDNKLTLQAKNILFLIKSWWGWMKCRWVVKRFSNSTQIIHYPHNYFGVNTCSASIPHNSKVCVILFYTVCTISVWRKEWGIESFVSHTLLRNMREKDLKKAISYHMKKILSQEPKQKVCACVHVCFSLSIVWKNVNHLHYMPIQ